MLLLQQLPDETRIRESTARVAGRRHREEIELINNWHLNERLPKKMYLSLRNDF